jgi:hypothetical protein
MLLPQYATKVITDGALSSPYSDVDRGAKWHARGLFNPQSILVRQPSHVGGWRRSRRKSQLASIVFLLGSVIAQIKAGSHACYFFQPEEHVTYKRDNDDYSPPLRFVDYMSICQT